MKKMSRRITALLLGVMMVISQAACGNKTDNAQAVSNSKDYVYRTETLPVSYEVNNINSLFMAGDSKYVYGNDWDEVTYESKLVLCRLNDDGSVQEKSIIDVPEGVYYNSLAGDSQGNIYCLKNQTTYTDSSGAVIPYNEKRMFQAVSGDRTKETREDAATEEETAEDTTGTEDTAGTEDTSAAEETTVIDIMPEEEMPGDYGAVTESCYLIQMAMDGSEIWSVRLNEIGELANDEYFYAGGMICTQNGKILINAMGQYAIFDNQGNYEGILQLSGSDAGRLKDNAGNMMLLNDGRVVIYLYEESGITFWEVNPETGALGEAMKMPGASYSYSFYPGVSYDLYLSDSSNVYGFNFGMEAPVKLMNFVDSDLSIYSIYNIMGISDTEFWGFMDDETEGRRLLVNFIKVKPEDVPDKELLTLACGYMDWRVKTQVVKFNKSNARYRIRIDDYGTMYNTNEDYRLGATKLNADIVSGRVPDIIVLSSDIPGASYISKGLFEDMKPYIEKDEALDMGNYMPNVIEAFSTNEHLYQLVPSYSISTVLAKTSLVGSEPGWTLQEAQELLATKPEGTQLFGDATQWTILYNSMMMCGDQFVDWAAGKCHYDSQGFINLLEFAKKYPKEIDYSTFEENYWERYDSQWRNEEVLTQIYYLSSFRDYNYITKATFGEPLTLIGFPSDNGTGTVINPNLSFAMSAKSKAKEGAWEFLRYYLTDEYQSTITYEWPLSIKRLDEIGEEATKKPSYQDENGEIITYDDITTIGGVEVIIDPLTPEEVEQLKQSIYGVKDVAVYSEELLNIIIEEAAPFFEGQKTAQDVADIIQSRAQIYVSENR